MAESAAESAGGPGSRGDERVDEGDPPLRDDVAMGRFEIASDGATAYLEYTRGPQRLVLLHTEIPPALEGRGFAGRLARHALELARRDGLAVTAECPFVLSYAQRNPRYRDLLLRVSGLASSEPPWMD